MNQPAALDPIAESQRQQSLQRRTTCTRLLLIFGIMLIWMGFPMLIIGGILADDIAGMIVAGVLIFLLGLFLTTLGCFRCRKDRRQESRGGGIGGAPQPIVSGYTPPAAFTQEPIQPQGGYYNPPPGHSYSEASAPPSYQDAMK